MNVGGLNTYIDLNGTHEVDLSTATSATINQLREAFQVQKIYERDARGGTRYTEIIKSHFGVPFKSIYVLRPPTFNLPSAGAAFKLPLAAAPVEFK